MRTGIGYDKVDVEAATAHGIAAINTPDAPTIDINVDAPHLAMRQLLREMIAAERAGATAEAMAG